MQLKSPILKISIILVSICTLNAQTPSVLFEVESSDKGILIPRTTTTAIANPVEGLLIYDTTNEGFMFYNGEKWIKLIDESTNDYYYADLDEDGFGNPYILVFSPNKPPNYVENGLDCDDDLSSINPNALEICDGIDNNCNGLIDDDDPDLTGQNTYYADTDEDGFGDLSSIVLACSPPVGYVENSLDCDDNFGNINPDAQEVCDGVDNDCDGLIDDEDDSLDPSPNCISCTLDCDDLLEFPPCFVDGVVCIDGVCNFSYRDDLCVINGTCYQQGDKNPMNECEECNPFSNQFNWTPVDDLTACSTGLCVGGQCQD